MKMQANFYRQSEKTRYSKSLAQSNTEWVHHQTRIECWHIERRPYQIDLVVVARVALCPTDGLSVFLPSS